MRCTFLWSCVGVVLYICGIACIMLALASCTNSAAFTDLAKGLNDAKISNCLYVQGQLPPYGNAYIYAKAGDLDCVAIWKARAQLGGS